MRQDGFRSPLQLREKKGLSVNRLSKSKLRLKIFCAFLTILLMYFHKPDFFSNKVWLVEGFIDVDAVFISLSLLLSSSVPGSPVARRESCTSSCFLPFFTLAEKETIKWLSFTFT